MGKYFNQYILDVISRMEMNITQCFNFNFILQMHYAVCLLYSPNTISMKSQPISSSFRPNEKARNPTLSS
jgi:hypothetical protein